MVYFFLFSIMTCRKHDVILLKLEVIVVYTNQPSKLSVRENVGMNTTINPASSICTFRLSSKFPMIYFEGSLPLFSFEVYDALVTPLNLGILLQYLPEIIGVSVFKQCFLLDYTPIFYFLIEGYYLL